MRNVAISWFQAGRESASQLARDSGVSPIDRGRNFLRSRFIKTALRFCPRPRIPARQYNCRSTLRCGHNTLKPWFFLHSQTTFGELVYESLAPQAKILVILKSGMRFSKGKSILWRSDFSKISRSIFQEMLSLKVNLISTYSQGVLSLKVNSISARRPIRSEKTRAGTRKYSSISDALT